VFLFLMLFAFVSNAQVNTAQKPGRLVGVIRDENNQPISGVTITAEKLKKATSTSVTGDYYLSLPPGTYTIIISYIGFETKQITDVVIKANEQTDLSSTLKRGNAKQLTGVVVTSSARRESTRGYLSDDLAPLENRADNSAEFAENSVNSITLNAALLKIPRDQAEAVVLIFQDGCTYEEAGKILDVPAGTVKSRVNRAMPLLAEILRELDPRTWNQKHA
jgi:RNA polymerase sigma factor (sigma-70 family)